MRFPVDVPQAKVRRTFERLDFAVVREGNHVIMERKNADGTVTPLVLPNHAHVKGSTLRSVCTQSGISREDFLVAFRQM
jgi:predicted RNA binding protein YcfA (HicA-like mRNA interferase family)